MKRLLLALMAAIAFTPAAKTQDLVQLVSWDKVNFDKKLLAGEFIDGEGTLPGVLKVSHAGPGPATITILELDGPGLDPAMGKYALVARVRHEDVDGVGYLEMWSHYGDGQKTVSRTLAGQGRTKSFSGTRNWRDIEVPNAVFRALGSRTPTKLVLNIVLPGRGILFMGPVALEQSKADSTWWDESTGGWLGGIGGSLLGLMGAAIGILTSTGRARSMVFGLLYLMIIIGACALTAGIIALILKQPYGVWYPLFLGGTIPFLLGLFLRPTIRKKFDMAELKRTQPMDGK